MEKLRELRKEAGMTQAELAEEIGVSAITLWKWESGYRLPKIENLIKLAAALDVDLWELDEERFPIPKKDEGSAVTITKKEYAYLKDIERRYRIMESAVIERS